MKFCIVIAALLALVACQNKEQEARRRQAESTCAKVRQVSPSFLDLACTPGAIERYVKEGGR